MAIIWHFQLIAVTSQPVDIAHFISSFCNSFCESNFLLKREIQGSFIGIIVNVMPLLPGLWVEQRSPTTGENKRPDESFWYPYNSSRIFIKTIRKVIRIRDHSQSLQLSVASQHSCLGIIQMLLEAKTVTMINIGQIIDQ